MLFWINPEWNLIPPEIAPLSPVQRESLAKKAAVTFDVNPIVVRIRLDSLFP
jgi:hypothetical protein